MPRIEISLSQIRENVKKLSELYMQKGISLMGVTKAVLGEPFIAKAMIQGGVKFIADSRIENIQKIICDHFNIKITDLKSKRRHRNITLPRQVAMYLCRKYTSVSFPTIGEKFGGRDHSTVIHACKNIEKRTISDIDFQQKIENMKNGISGQKIHTLEKGNT
mgnify:CR=1 FL=1